jgi:hypothetical protein
LLTLEIRSRTIQKQDPAKRNRVVLASRSSLFVMMMTVMAMMGGGIGRNHRTSQNHNCDNGKEQYAQFHGEYSFEPTAFMHAAV